MIPSSDLQKILSCPFYYPSAIFLLLVIKNIIGVVAC